MLEGDLRCIECVLGSFCHINTKHALKAILVWYANPLINSTSCNSEVFFCTNFEVEMQYFLCANCVPMSTQIHNTLYVSFGLKYLQDKGKQILNHKQKQLRKLTLYPTELRAHLIRL